MKTILIVDDSPTDLQALMAALDGKGYNLMTATDGEEAVRKAVQQRPDLILLDLVLPKKNGFQVCRLVKTTPETRHIKVVVVSGKDQESDRFWGLKQGADEYLVKPVKSEHLMAAVTKFL